MTDKRIREIIAETAILNDLLALRLYKLVSIPINHKNLEKSIKRSFNQTNNLSKVMDSKLGKRAEAFGEMYDKIDEIIGEILKSVTE